jgi:prepilin-type N-terminal cleavage/methylation domain-containing protein
MNQKHTAFTLIELLVVIVIIGILATIGVAQFNTYQEKARLAKAQAFAKQAQTVLLAESAANAKPPLAVFPLNETTGTVARDTSGNGAAGTSSVSKWSDLSPYEGQGSWYNENSGDYLNVDIVYTSIDALTISAWVYVTGDSGPMSPVSLAFSSGWSGMAYSGQWRFYGPTPTAGDALETNTSLSKNTWHHLLASYDGQTQIFYIDGELVASRAEADLFTLPVERIYLGSTTTNPSSSYISDVQVYQVPFNF